MRRLLPLLSLVLLVTGPAQASDLSRFNGAVESAYQPIRSAAFYLRTGNPMVATLELEEADALWRESVLPFVSATPDAFSDDAHFGPALQGIGERLVEAAGLAAEGEAEAAADALAPIREELSVLRRRNGVIVFSDRVDAANAAMDRLWVYRHELPDWQNPAAVDGLEAATAIARYLYGRCLEEAPAEVAAAPEFRRIVGGAIESLDKLPAAINATDGETVISILRELRSFDRLLWLQFG